MKRALIVVVLFLVSATLQAAEEIGRFEINGECNTSYKAAWEWTSDSETSERIIVIIDNTGACKITVSKHVGEKEPSIGSAKGGQKGGGNSTLHKGTTELGFSCANELGGMCKGTVRILLR